MDRSSRRRARVLLIGMLALLLGACSPGATPPATPAATSVAGLRPTAMPRPTDPPPRPTDPPPPTEAAEQDAEPSTPTPEAQPTEQPPAELPPIVEGQTVLTLVRGAGNGNIGANATFRIGADGSIRVLDSDNRRLLFYGQSGTLQREQPLAEANSPLDFIVANTGELFVLDSTGDAPGRAGMVLRYGADGALVEQIALGENMSGAALMLNSQNYLFVVNGTYSYALIQHDGVAVPAETQRFTTHNGAITPRSPVAFLTQYDPETAETDISIRNLTDTNSPYHVLTAPGLQHFFNIDREMNVYTTSPLSDVREGIAVRRYSPSGQLLGGAQINVAGCEMGAGADRQFYIDQLGAAWTLCLTPAGATVTRYSLVDGLGQPLPEASDRPAETYWNPDPRASPA